jgi:hypothetical protein
MSDADIIAWFRNGGECAERGEQCRVMEAASGCNCALIADTIAALEARVKELEAALRSAYEVYAGSDGFIPETAAEGYQQQIIKQMVDCISAALSQPAPNRETDWGPDVGNEILPPPPENGE